MSNVMLTFKIKVKDRNQVRLPQIRRTRMNLSSLRSHPKLGGLSNSTLCEAAASRYVRDTLKVPQVLDLDNLPANVLVEDGFLTIIRIRDEAPV